MISKFKTAPLASFITAMTVVLAVAVYLQGAGVITGRAGAILTTVIGVINVLLGLYARSQVTPLTDPKNELGQQLVTRKSNY